MRRYAGAALHDYIAENLHTYIYGRGISSLIAPHSSSGRVRISSWVSPTRSTARSRVPEGRPLMHNLLLSFVMLPVTGILLLIAVALPIVLSVTFHVAGIHDPRRSHAHPRLPALYRAGLHRRGRALSLAAESSALLGLCLARRRRRRRRMARGAIRFRGIRNARGLHAHLRSALGAARLAALVLLHRLDLSLRRRVRHLALDRISGPRARRAMAHV